jgi:hypothetical protein
MQLLPHTAAMDSLLLEARHPQLFWLNLWGEWQVPARARAGKAHIKISILFFQYLCDYMFILIRSMHMFANEFYGGNGIVG